MEHTAKYLITAMLALCAMTACSDIDDDLSEIGSRISRVTAANNGMNARLDSMRRELTYFYEDVALSFVVQNADGSLTVHFLSGKVVTVPAAFNGVNGRDGRDGVDGTAPVISARADADGHIYWTADGEWMTDADGNRLRADADDGRDGRNGRDGVDGQNGHDGRDGIDGVNGRDGHDGRDGADDLDAVLTVPVVTINPETGMWQVSVDGGRTWIDMGVSADGRDGRDGRDGSDGKDGKDGAPDIFANVIVDSYTGTVTIVLIDGTTFTMNMS